MVTPTMNGNRAERKQLSQQLDRLDVILDGLADALEQSVANAVKEVVGEVVREAVESTLKEVLGNPTLLQAAMNAQMRQTQSQPPQAQPAQPNPTTSRLCSFFTTAKNALGSLVEKARQAAGVVASSVGTVCSWAVGKAKTATKVATDTVRTLWHFRAITTLAVGAGVIAGVAGYMSGPVIASVLCGLGSTALTALGMVLYPLCRLMRGDTSV